jgi:TolA-binding protein
MRLLSRLLFCVLAIALHLGILNAQQGLLPGSAQQSYQTGLELFQHQKFVAARHCFEQVVDQGISIGTNLRAEASRYLTLCSIELQNDDAETLYARYAGDFSWHPGVNEASNKLGMMFYNLKKYDKAMLYYAKVQPNMLNKEQQAEYYFTYGYSAFVQQDMNKARVCFYEIKDIDSRYNAPANYYYAHIAYNDKNYQTAIESFNKLKDDETFAPLVPYYITQCLYLQGKYEELVAYAPALIDSVVSGRTAEMSKLVGDAYYRLNRFKEAIPYLERFAKENTPNKEDQYQLAYCYYNTNKFAEAIPLFQPAAQGTDALAQNALFHLGDCYIRTNDKSKACLSFGSASKMDFDARLKEDALFNYAVLLYETSYSALNDAVKVFNEFLQLYPNSSKIDEVYQHLVAAYSNTKNYKEALASIEKIKVKDNGIKRAYQKIAFYRGLELYNDQRYQEAQKIFDKSLNYADFDRSLGARASYWIAECYYRMSKYDEAIAEYERFLATPGSYSLNEYNLAHYNLGYAHFNLKDYTNALIWFRKYLTINDKKQKNLLADACNRTGDCYFMAQNYIDAIELYSKSIQLGKADRDYAMFQKAFCLGLQGQYKQKNTLLKDLMTQSPKSAYFDDALYESGRSFLDLQDNKQADAFFKRLIAEYPSSSYIPKALIQIGLIAYNDNKDDDAISAYKKVVDNYPGSPEAKRALTGIKNIYVDNNNVDAYLEYTETLGSFANVSTAEQDSLSYRAAENLFMQGDCDKATESINNYLTRFPNGTFVLNARYYRGECASRNGKTKQALDDFNYIASKPRSLFSEEALLAIGRIKMGDKKYAEALEAWKKLEPIAEDKGNLVEARLGAMRSYFNLKEYSNTIDAAKKVLVTENIADENQREAHFLMAQSALALNQTDNALSEYRIVAKDVKTEDGAQSEYQICKILFDAGKMDDAENEVFKFIDMNTPHQYWMAKSFLLLSDIYMKKNDDFQATQTLQSVIDNYDNKTDGILDEANKKLQVINDINASKPTYKASDVEIQLKK